MRAQPMQTLSRLALPLLLAAPLAQAQDVLLGRLTTPQTDLQLNGGASDPAISAEGLHLAIASTSSNLGVVSDGTTDIYVYDLANDVYRLGTSTLGNGNSFAPSIAAGGGTLVFESLASNLGGGGNFSDVFYSESFDAGQGEIAYNTFLVSRGFQGATPNGASRYASISDNGQFVVFWSDASNLISSDTNNGPDIFVGNASNFFAGTAELISRDNAGQPINGPSRPLSGQAISADGRYVAFAVDSPVSIDGSLVNNLEDVFVRDRSAGSTSLISRSSAGVAAIGSSDSAAISPNARYVVYRSFASNLVASPTGSRIYVRDRNLGTTVNMPLPPDAASCEDPRISNFADVIAQCNMNSGPAQVFLYRPSLGGVFYRLSTSTSAGGGNGVSGNVVGINATGELSVFDSAASNLVPNDTNNTTDAFIAIDADLLDRIFADGFEG